jgi:hypothetical protein
VLRIIIPAPWVDPEEEERNKYEKMKLKQKAVVDRLLEEF